MTRWTHQPHARRRPAGPRPNLPSREDRARRRRRRWRRAGRLTLWAGIAAVTWIGASALYGAMTPYLHRSLAITHVAVTGNDQVTRAEILEQLNLQSQDSLLSVNAKRLELRVEALPWVKDAIVSRSLPHTLAVHVVERRPGAILHGSTRHLLLDEEGYPLAEVARTDERALPVLVGLNPARLLGRDPDGLKTAAKGVELATLLARTFSGRPEVDVANPDNIVAYVHGLRLQFGTAGFEEKWNLYRKMEPHLAGTIGSVRGEERSEIDLRYPGKVIVRERG